MKAFGWGILEELKGARTHATDSYSLRRLSCDIFLFRVLRLWPALATPARTRTVRLDNATITYRLNRGDIQSIREVWLAEAYRLPPGFRPRVVLDLGANIGLVSVWFAKTYDCDRIVAVEPDPANAEIVRRNLKANGIRGEIVQAAVGPVDGTARFAFSRHSNLGSVVSTRGRIGEAADVTMLTPQSIMLQTHLAHIDLCKLDIEGGEGPLFLQGELAWLSSVGAIVAELHGEMIDAPAVIRAIEDAGLSYFPPDSAGCKMELFVGSNSSGFFVR